MVRIAHVVNGAVVNVSVAEKLGKGDIDGTDAAIGDIYKDGKFIKPPVVEFVPDEVDGWKLKAVIELRGLGPAIDEAIESIADPRLRVIAHHCFESGPCCRTSKTVVEVFKKAGVVEKDLDALYLEANFIRMD